MTIRKYPSPEAFKQALEQRLRTSAKHGADFGRRRQLLVFDRFLARVIAVLGDSVILKGGLVLELRLERARTTKDVDLRMVGSPNDVLAKLQEAARRDLADFMTFEVGSDESQPAIAWATPFAVMARDDELRWGTLEEVTHAAQHFLDPVLLGEVAARWDPDSWSWR